MKTVKIIEAGNETFWAAESEDGVEAKRFKKYAIVTTGRFTRSYSTGWRMFREFYKLRADGTAKFIEER